MSSFANTASLFGQSGGFSLAPTAPTHPEPQELRPLHLIAEEERLAASTLSTNKRKREDDEDEDEDSDDDSDDDSDSDEDEDEDEDDDEDDPAMDNMVSRPTNAFAPGVRAHSMQKPSADGEASSTDGLNDLNELDNRMARDPAFGDDFDIDQFEHEASASPSAHGWNPINAGSVAPARPQTSSRVRPSQAQSPSGGSKVTFSTPKGNVPAVPRRSGNKSNHNAPKWGDKENLALLKLSEDPAYMRLTEQERGQKHHDAGLTPNGHFRGYEACRQNIKKLVNLGRTVASVQDDIEKAEAMETAQTLVSLASQTPAPAPAPASSSAPASSPAPASASDSDA